MYAKWNTITGLANKLAWLQTNAESNGIYVLEVSTNENIEPHTLSYSGRNDIAIILMGVGANQTISLSSNGSMFTVSSGVTLILDNNITLRGHNSNTSSLVYVSGGTLKMNTGSAISGNTKSSFYGGGVYVDSGIFTMNGGTISGNTVSSGVGGGVYVGSGIFTMNGGTISGNTASTSSVGGGVYVSNGTFTMNGGTISGNTGNFGGGVYVTGSNSNFTMNGGTISDNSRGGVYVDSGTFTMEGGEISGNTSSSYGGGVYVVSGTFTMEGGEISGNISSSYGGGVYVGNGTFFTMDGGEISENTSSSGGGGVYAAGTCTMNGGEISGNTVLSSNAIGTIGGGGVYVGGSFTMNGGEISGNTASSNSSILASGGGVYVGGSFTMNGGEISSNTASSGIGGGVCVSSNGNNSKFTMNGGTVYGSRMSGIPAEFANVADTGAALYASLRARYGDGTDILPHTDGQSSYTNDTIIGTSVTVTVIVAYDINRGTGTTPAAQTVNIGSSITLPDGSGLTRSGYAFGGWNTNTFGTGATYNVNTSYTPTRSIILYAKWEPITVVPGANLAAKLAWLQINSLSGIEYTVEVNANESIEPHSLYYSGRSNITIRLLGIGAVRTISLSSNGSMFSVSSCTLILDNNITLRGHNSNTSSLVYVSSGMLIMNTGSVISGNTTSWGGAGVRVEDGVTFTMNGGTISNNNTSSSNYGGGGVFVNGGTFTMNGGTISSNTAKECGGGVYLYRGTFTMRDTASVSGNTASVGGGVCLNDGTFTMRDNASVSGNAARLGSGVNLAGGNFIISGGNVYGSNASASLQNKPVEGGDWGGLALFVEVYGTVARTAKYGNGTNILPHTDGQRDLTNATITGRQ